MGRLWSDLGPIKTYWEGACSHSFPSFQAVVVLLIQGRSWLLIFQVGHSVKLPCIVRQIGSKTVRIQQKYKTKTHTNTILIRIYYVSIFHLNRINLKLIKFAIFTTSEYSFWLSVDFCLFPGDSRKLSVLVHQSLVKANEMCCFHMDIAPTGEGCKGLPGWLGPLFSTFACLTEGGGGSQAIWAMPI